ncbi:MAG TPA: hypothetical protein VG273_11950 [Bryobacteraceae bacterium]|jgi:CBS domain-containing protein|nr:hypothetical protein [Bryobacteraceae bacterium]
MMNLPVVRPETALLAIADLIRPEMDAPDADVGCLEEALMLIKQENPQVIAAVTVMTAEETPELQMAALVGMLTTYRVLRAQAEVDALTRMALA